MTPSELSHGTAHLPAADLKAIDIEGPIAES
jgi:hypothetical protein